MKKLPITIGEYFLDHYFAGGSHPYFGIWEVSGKEFKLVVVAVYRKGAEEVLRRLTEPKPQIPKEGGEGMS